MSKNAECDRKENVACEYVVSVRKTIDSDGHEADAVLPRWVRVQSALKEMCEDAKVTFDYLRNVGICGVLTLAIPQFDKVVQSIFPSWDKLCDGNLRLAAMFGAFAIILGLYGFNALWLSFNIKRKPISRLTGFISSLVVSVTITVLFASGTIVKALQLLGYIKSVA